jgi:hypothetical protein
MSSVYQHNDDLEMDLQSYHHDSEKVDTAIQSLESMTLTQDLMMDGDPGLDPTAYKLISNSVECFMKLAKIGTTGPIMPALESFTQPFDISQAALEGLGEGIKNVFLSIINAIKKAFQWMGGLIKRLFGRNKDHEEKIAELKHKAEEVKEKVSEMSDDEKRGAPAPRDSQGWFTKVELTNPNMLRKIVTSKGIMDQNYLNKVTTEFIRVFHTQPGNVNTASLIRNDYDFDDINYVVPFDETRDNALIQQVSSGNSGGKVYASMELGDNTYIYVHVPPIPEHNVSDTREKAKASLQWADGLRIGKVKVGGNINLNQYKEITGDLADADKIIELVQFMNKIVLQRAEELNVFMKAKDRFLKDFENRIRQLGVKLWSDNDLKLQRDNLMYHLKFFRKVMDEPALSYYGACDGIIQAFINLAAYVMHYNHTNGNKVELKK